MTKSISEWVGIVHGLAVEKGWHETEQNPAQFAANLHGEVSEFWEAYRAGNLNNPCDKNVKMIAAVGESLTCAEEELADVVIRAMDTAGAMGIDLEKAIRVKHAYNATRPHRHGGKLA